MTAAAWLCLAFVVIASTIPAQFARENARDRAERDVAWTPRPKRMYEAPFGQPGLPLPHRPEGMASLKAEIGRHRVPELKVRKAHPDWPWDKQEFEMRWDEWFANQPDDQHVVYEWAGTGHA